MKGKKHVKEIKDLAYYLIIFKIEGHETWRTHIYGHKSGFDEVVARDHMKITEKMVKRIDRITGEITDEK